MLGHVQRSSQNLTVRYQIVWNGVDLGMVVVTLTELLYQRASKYLYNYGKLTCLYPVAPSVQGMFLRNYEAERRFKLI